MGNKKEEKVSKREPFCEAPRALAMVFTLGDAGCESGVSPNSHSVVLPSQTTNGVCSDNRPPCFQ